MAVEVGVELQSIDPLRRVHKTLAAIAVLIMLIVLCGGVPYLSRLVLLSLR